VLIRSIGLRQAASSGGSGGSGGPDGTAYYVPLAVDHTLVASDQTDFPIFVDLSFMPAAFWAHVASGGGDIRVTLDDGSTRLPVDLVAIDTGAQAGWVHVKVGTLSSSTDTVIRVYYGATGLSQPAATDTYGRNAVWSDYAFVSHDGGRTDATGNHTPAVHNVTDGSHGFMGPTGAFNGSNSHIIVSGAGGISNELTKQFWGRPATGATHDMRWFANNTLTSVYFQDSYGSGLNANTFNGSNHYTLAGVGSSLTRGAWTAVHYTVSHGAGVGRLYVNGTQTGGDASDSITFSSSSALRIGSHRAGVNWVKGEIGEIRTRHAALTADWITAEYANQSDPSTFYSVGSEQGA